MATAAHYNMVATVAEIILLLTSTPINSTFSENEVELCIARET
jgi:hypothetical protein